MHRSSLLAAAALSLAFVACKQPDASATRNAIALPKAPVTSEPAPPAQPAAPDTTPPPPPVGVAPSVPATAVAAAPPHAATTVAPKRPRGSVRTAPRTMRASLAKKTALPPPTPASAGSAFGGRDMHPYDAAPLAPVARLDIDMKPYD